MLELHVWGPGFGLPSIDPQCLAAIAYLNLLLPRSEWKLVPSSNPLLSPNKQLPALLVTSPRPVWISGLPQIVAYFSQLPSPLDLEADLTPRERATSLALSALIQARAQPIIDLALWVDRKNYAAVTRPLIAGMLPWPMSWIEPGTRRVAARERVSVLGMAKEEEKERAPVIGETVGERAVREAEGGANVARRGEIGRELALKRVLAELVEPLLKQVLMSDGPFLLGEVPSVVDCVALGYLSCLLMPECPNDWAGEGLRKRERLAAYVHDMRARMLQGVQVGKVEKADLPWLGGVLVDGFKRTVEEWTGKKGDEEWRDEDPLVEEKKRKAAMARRREWWKSVAFVLAGVVGMGTYVVWSGIVAIGHVEDEEEEAEEEHMKDTVVRGDEEDEDGDIVRDGHEE
ncbi:Tom37 C-terminal domain-containing protein [Sphaerosporella brunnea]|uniref:Tom37 C-terminal domain-containing protein n=1 Tax=Sphaerosporella brunnea TaxID=1250544 RepID=A0A5J5F706_9PEZI|nr:Tom37 C-terminal domain-containing protein [Sphaerosporella brunnea]